MVLGWQTKGFNPAILHASLEVCIAQLAPKSLTAVPRALPSSLLLHPREQGTTRSWANRPPAAPVTSQHRPPNSSYYQLVRKVKGSSSCCLGRERKRWRKHWSDLQAGFNPCQKVWSTENMSQHITKTEHTVISSSKLKQNSPPSQDFVWDSPDLTKRALVRHTPYTVKISRLLMLFKYDQNRSILQMLSPKLPSLFTYNSDIPSGI